MIIYFYLFVGNFTTLYQLQGYPASNHTECALANTWRVWKDNNGSYCSLFQNKYSSIRMEWLIKCIKDVTQSSSALSEIRTGSLQSTESFNRIYIAEN
jgi:hypothetical protein